MNSFYCAYLRAAITPMCCLNRQISKQQYDPCFSGECEQGIQVKSASTHVPAVEPVIKKPAKRSRTRHRRNTSPYTYHYQPNGVEAENRPVLSFSETDILSKLIEPGEDRIYAGV